MPKLRYDLCFKQEMRVMYRKNILLLFEALYKEKNPSQRQCRSKPCVEYCDEMEWEQLKSPDQYPTSDHHHHDHKGREASHD